jgi:DNA-binding NarL/FixJ family response regulator
VAGCIRILVVDDHRMFAQSLVRILEDEPDIEVVGIAGTAEAACAAALEHSPGVVLVDYGLPDTDGVGAIDALRKVVPAAEFVMLTGHTEPEVLAAAIDVGVRGFVTKDKATDELLDAVRAAAVGESIISPAMLAQLLPQLRRTDPQPARIELSGRELEILGLLAEGLSTEAIAARLMLSRNTIRNHVQRVMTRLGAHSRLEAVAIATRRGLMVG